MALTTCPDCGKEHSDLAPACPSCGRPSSKPLEPPSSPKAKPKGGCLPGCLVVLVGLAILAGITSAFDEAGRTDKVQGCNSGNAGDCEALLNDGDFKEYQQITNADYQAKFKEKQAKAAKANADQMLIYACEDALKKSLKDPDSLKILGKDRQNLLIEYTATNSFGGRVRNVLDCKTGKTLN